MAKTKKTKPAAKPRKPAGRKPAALPTPTVLPPERVHELLGLYPPYQPDQPPPDLPDYLTVWDPGLSVFDLRTQFRHLFYPMDWYDRQPLARATSGRLWRQIRVEPVALGQPHAEPKTAAGVYTPPAREVVALLIVHFLATGEYLFPRFRVRCREVVHTGNRVVVGQFTPLGMVIGSASDNLVSPAIGQASAVSVAR